MPYGQATAGVAQLFGDKGCHLVWRHSGAHQPIGRTKLVPESSHFVGFLRLRNDHRRIRRAAQINVAGIPYDADDLPGNVFELRAQAVANDDLLTKRILIWPELDRKSTRLNSSHLGISYAVFCLKK